MSKALYTPLNLGQKEIRLLEIQKGDFADEIECNLLTILLTDNPQYDALSYVWGNRYAPGPISVGEQSVQITLNLEAAIRHLRRSDRPFVVWIDALCINQKNTLERNQQVAMMGDIYRKAKDAFVWLGETDAESSEALSTIEPFGRDIAMHWNPELSHSISAELVEPSRFVAISNFLRRPWWTRVWTVQEAILPERLVLFCGPRRVAADHLFEFSKSFFRHMNNCCRQFFVLRDATIINDLINQVDSLYTMEYFRSTRDRVLFSEQMSYYRLRVCKEPKDKIYGFLGFGDKAQTAAIKPDYSLSDRTVYEEAARKMLDSREDLAMLSEVLPEQSMRTDSLIEGLPSWVPDWTVKVPFDVIRSTHHVRQSKFKQYNASKGRKPSVRYPDPGKIALRGVIFGTVGTLGDARERGARTASREDVPIIKGWRKLAHIDDNPDRPYRGSRQTETDKTSPETMYDAFWQVLCSSLAPETSDAQTIEELIRIKDLPAARAAHEAAWNWLNSPVEYSSDHRIRLFLTCLSISIGSRRLFLSKDDHEWIGLALLSAQEDDRIVVLEGGDVPYIIPSARGGREAGVDFYW